jgi:hypothetical protein
MWAQRYLHFYPDQSKTVIIDGIVTQVPARSPRLLRPRFLSSFLASSLFAARRPWPAADV